MKTDELSTTPQRQSATLRMSQLQGEQYTSPTMGNIIAGEGFSSVNDIVASKDNLLMRCKDTIEELNKEVDKERKNKEYISKSLFGVNTELEESKHKLIERDEKLETLENNNRSLAEDLEEAKEKVQHLSLLVKELKTSEKSNANEVEYKSAVVASTEQERRDLRQNNEELLAMVDERDKQIKDLIHIIEELEGKVAENEERYKEIIMTLKSANEQIDVLKNELDASHIRSKELYKDNKELKGTLKNQEALIDTLKAQYKDKENELRVMLDLKEEKHKSEFAAREKEVKDSSVQFRTELDKSVQQMLSDCEKYKAENISLRNELNKTKEIFDEKTLTITRESSNKDTTIALLKKQVSDRDAEIRDLREGQYSTDKSKAGILEELRQNNEQIFAIKKEYMDEIDRLSEILKTLSFNNERLNDKYTEESLKLEKAEDVIEEYKRVIDDLSKSKDNKMQELVDVEVENERLKKAVDVTLISS